ncbi:MAG: hypothetical protein Q4F31_00430 [Eubacteriales bacterium]|nr:hypothetical protein [Eubacteriales bacterium]
MKSFTSEKKLNKICLGIEDRKEQFFLIVFVLWFSLDFFYSLELGKYEIGKNTYYLRILSPIKYAALLLALTQNNGSLKDLLMKLSVALFLYITARGSLFFDLFYSWILLWASENVEFKKIVKISAVMLSVYLPLTFIACKVGILDEVHGIFRNGIERKGFGFQHPNHMAFRVFSLLICLCFLLKDKRNPAVYLFSAISLYVLWNYQNSRASCGCILIMTLLFSLRFFFYRMNTRRQRFVLFSFVVGAILVNILMVFLTLTYKGSGVYQALNRALSDRLLFGNEAFQENGLSVFGQRIFLTMSERKAAGLAGQIIIDCAYMNILLRGGILTYVGFSMAYAYGMIKYAKANDFLKVSILFVMACFGAIELDLYQVSANIFLFLLPMFPDRSDICLL